MNGATLPLWAEVLVSILLLVSGFLALCSAMGLVRLDSFFSRMHAPSLTASLGVWCVTTAAVLYFSLLDGELAMNYWLIALLISITAPIANVVLVRAGLFRLRVRNTPEIPPPLRLRVVPTDED